MILLWIGIAVIILLLAALTISYICFRIAFYVPHRKVGPVDEPDTPEGEIYDVWRADMENWIIEARGMVTDKFFITSYDGLKLCGKYYEYAPGAPIELMFHGYRGNAERDLSGGVQRCFKLGRSALIVDQRGSRESEGNVITFGIKEHRDCLCWVDFMVKHFGSDVKIILTGISMGASTVLMASGYNLPSNVIGVLADCGFSSPKEIIKDVIKKMGLPQNIAYPFVKLGARLFGKFDLEELTPTEAVKKSKIPTIFFHGDADDFVPCEMSRINYDACAARKMLVTVKGAGHGLGYLMDKEGYFNALRQFFGE